MLSSSIGPSAKPSVGRPNAAVAMPPAASAPPVMNPRRVTVSPSNAPGVPRSLVYRDLRLGFCLEGEFCHGRASSWSEG